MWHIYSSIAVLFVGAYCYPHRNTADQSQCTVVIKRFDEPVKNLEVEWDSTIHLICDASCVGPGPQPALTWFYRDKNQTKLINIEKLFRSTKFETYPTNYHRKNELIIRDFGPNEETTFICIGSRKVHKPKAEVELIGTDCLLKYKFRCQMGKRCIDRGYLCNHNNECPDGEDEVGCGYDTTTVATMRMPEKDLVIKQTSDESNNIDLTTTVSTMMMPDTDDETKQTSEESYYIDIPITVSTMRMPETDVETMQTSEESNKIDITTTVSTMRLPESTMEVKQTTEERTPCEFGCRDGTCIASTKKCDGIPDCPDGDDETSCGFGLICPEGKKACKDSSNCIDDSQRCNDVQDCSDGGDEEDCGLETAEILMGSNGIHADGDTDPFSTTDGVTAKTGKFIKTTLFDYEFYVD